MTAAAGRTRNMKVQHYGTGRRKTASARVYLKRGSGAITVNGRSLDEYFGGLERAKILVKKPLSIVNMTKTVDLRIFVKGSGPLGQAGAMSHGIARALVAFDAQEGQPVEVNVAPSLEMGAMNGEGAAQEQPLTLRQQLRKARCLRRDARKVERKKVGYRKARKVEQYSKR